VPLRLSAAKALPNRSILPNNSGPANGLPNKSRRQPTQIELLAVKHSVSVYPYLMEGPQRMTRIHSILAVVLSTSGLYVAQDFIDRPRVFTVEQAEAGRKELAVNAFGACADCHTTSLTGRSGDAGEVPELSSIEEGMRRTVLSMGGKVPALVGPKFLARWNTRSTKDLSADFKGRFSGPLKEETQLNIIAYILQLNGASPGSQRLTMSADVEIGKLMSTSFR
jgi:hypothetical protein